MKKAFIFTLDALFAVMIMVLFFTAFSLEMNVPKQTYWLSEIGDSFMTSLDKTGVFYKIYDQTDAQAQASLLAQMKNLSNKINGRMKVQIYSGAADVFTLQRTIEVNKGAVSESQEAHVKRVFSDPATNRFGIVELVISYG